MANAVKKVNGIAIADIKNINGITDSNLKKLNTLEFTGTRTPPADAHVLISTPLSITTSDTAVSDITITSGIDSTYDVYEFVFTNLHPASTGVAFQFQVNDSGDEGGDYDESPITSTHWQSYHNAADTAAAINYSGGNDLANSASFQNLFQGLVNGNDSSGSGTFTLYAPSSTTYVKQWTGNFNFHNSDPHYTTQAFTGGYINDATAITQIRFKFSSGNIDAGELKMYGLWK